jgi:hypothetical protein
MRSHGPGIIGLQHTSDAVGPSCGADSHRARSQKRGRGTYHAPGPSAGEGTGKGEGGNEEERTKHEERVGLWQVLRPHATKNATCNRQRAEGTGRNTIHCNLPAAFCILDIYAPVGGP